MIGEVKSMFGYCPLKAKSLGINAAVVLETIEWHYLSGMTVQILMEIMPWFTERKIREAIKKLEFEDLIVAIRTTNSNRTKLYFSKESYDKFLKNKGAIT